MSFGEPDDVPGQCNAHLYVGDDHGDNHATMRCSLPKEHDGRHQEIFRQETATITWEKDERDYSPQCTCYTILTGQVPCTRATTIKLDTPCSCGCVRCKDEPR